MTHTPAPFPPMDPTSRILTVRGQKVILDSDLAALYGVPTKRLNEQVRRNIKRFPQDFMFRLTHQEVASLKSQFATSSSQAVHGECINYNRSQNATGSTKHRDPRLRPYAFTEHGAIMAATILKSPRAIQMSVFVVRAFVRMRTALTANRDLARKLAALETELTSRLDSHESAIVDILRRLMEIIAPPAYPDPPQKQIGFARERRATYRPGQRRVRT